MYGEYRGGITCWKHAIKYRPSNRLTSRTLHCSEPMYRLCNV